MATYGVKYYFVFVSEMGKEYRIRIAKKNYTGTSSQRRLGQTPVWKLENNENIYGSSLELWLQCDVDGEYREFFTSSPDEYKVILEKESSGNYTPIWEGFLVPELYSEPIVHVPYDIQVIATDGLGELKYHTFPGYGALPFNTLLSRLLAFTGFVRNIYYWSTLAGRYTDNTGVSTEITASQFLASSTIDMDSMKGETCYDVLQAVLASINASIRAIQYDKWAVIRYDDVPYNDSTMTLADVNGNIATLDYINEADFFPVGYLTKTISPATNGMTVISDNAYKDAGNPNGEIEKGDIGWTKSSGVTYTGHNAQTGMPAHYTLPYNSQGQEKSISQSFNIYNADKRLLPGGKFELSAALDSPFSSKLKVEIYADYSSGQRRWVGKFNDWIIWTSNQYIWEFEVTNANYQYGTVDFQDPQDFSIEIPGDGGSVDQGAYMVSLHIVITNAYLGSTSADVHIYKAALTLNSFTGYKNTITINNGARDNLGEIKTYFPGQINNDTYNFGRFAYQTPMFNEYPIDRWKTSRFSTLMSHLSLLSREKARQSASATYKVTGDICTSGEAPLGGFFNFDSSQENYSARTLTWKIFDEECEIELAQIPTASITITSETTTKIK